MAALKSSHFYFTMNYLSHYFLDAKPSRHYFNFGLVLPDMMGATMRGWKPDFDKFTFPLLQHKELIEGVRKHHMADAYFHSSAFFTENTVNIRKIFEENGFSQPNTRLFFVAHIFLEFMLDRLILQHHNNSADGFYADVEKIEHSVLQQFFDSHQTNGERFYTFLENFRKYEYLRTYLQDDRLFFALNRTLQRANQNTYPEDKLTQFSKVVILPAEKLLRPVYLDFFTEMRSKMI